MGVGTIIASAIAILLLIITAYVLLAGTLTTAQTVVVAQRALADQEARRVNTRIEILNASADGVGQKVYIDLKNTGGEVVADFDRMEVYLLQDSAGVISPGTYTNISVPWNWTYAISPDTVNPRLLDPDEVANISVSYDPAMGTPLWAKVTTANGVYDSKYL